MPIRTLLRFAAAPLAVVVVAFLSELTTLTLFDDPFVLFYPLVLVGACVSGMQSALLATGLAAIATDRLFLTSMYSSAGHSSGQDAWLTTFVFGGAILSVVAGALRELARPVTDARRGYVEERHAEERRVEERRVDRGALPAGKRRAWRFMPTAHDGGTARLDVVPRAG